MSFKLFILTCLIAILSVSAKFVDVVVSPDGSLTYTPETVTIAVGDTVRFGWDGSNHDVVSAAPNSCTTVSGPIKSDVLNRGATFNVTFTEAGTFPYICTVANHCAAGMRGVVIVGGNATATTAKPTTTGAPAPTTSKTSFGYKLAPAFVMAALMMI